MMLSQSLFESVFNSSSVGNYLLSPTPEATILAVNDAFLEASSRKREELLGVSLFVAFPGNPNDPEDTGESALRQSLARVLASGKPDSLPAQRYPIPVELPDGTLRYEERFWSAVSTPIFDQDGRIACISHTTSDVTEQVRSSAALRESEVRFRALTNATADVVYRMSPDWSQMRQLQGRGFLKDVNKAADFWLDDYIPPEDQAIVHQAIREAIQGKKTFELEHRVLRVDGSCGWTLSRAVPMLDANDDIYEWIGTASDITERKEAEQKLRDADRRKDEFLAMLAHELRNPLAPIGTAAKLLQVTHLSENRVRQSSEIIARQVSHMTHLIDDLLDVSRVTKGLVTLQKTQLDIRRIIGDAVEQATPLFQSRQQQISLDLPPHGTIVTGDKKRLVQVLANILNNAAKYTPENGRIALGTKLEDVHVLICVSDNGIGMTPDTAAHAFDLFTQAERTPDRTSGGLGLGLALVKSLVDLHGGTVKCESRGIGSGSTFTICLPRLAASDVKTMREERGRDGKSSASLRAMVVDDNADAAAMLAMLLEASGHHAIVEHDSTQAIEAAQKLAPQICLLDIGLPGIDGNELAQRLRALPQTENAVLVAITGYGQESDRARALAAGFDYYLVKPVDTKKLYSILDRIGAH